MGFLEPFDLGAEFIAFAAKVLEPGRLSRETRLHFLFHALPVCFMGSAFLRKALVGTGKKLLTEKIRSLLLALYPGLLGRATRVFKPLGFGGDPFLHFLLQLLSCRLRLFLNIAQPQCQLLVEAVFQFFLQHAARLGRSRLGLLVLLILTRVLFLEPESQIGFETALQVLFALLPGCVGLFLNVPEPLRKIHIELLGEFFFEFAPGFFRGGLHLLAEFFLAGVFLIKLGRKYRFVLPPEFFLPGSFLLKLGCQFRFELLPEFFLPGVFLLKLGSQFRFVSLTQFRFGLLPGCAQLFL